MAERSGETSSTADASGPQKSPQKSLLESPQKPLPEPLPDLERRMLDFENRWPMHTGAKEAAIRAEFALTSARYYQVLNAALDLPEAVVFDPMLVGRLRRLRGARTEARAARVIGIDRSPHHH